MNILIDTLAADADTRNSRYKSSSQKTKSRQRQNNRKSKNKERLWVRALFYFVTAFLFVFLVLISAMYAYGMANYITVTVLSTIFISLLFSFAVFAYLLGKGKTLKDIVSELGLSKKRLTFRYISIGIGLFILFLIIEIGIGLFSELTKIQIVTNVATDLANMPLYFYLFAFLVAPINEEILFRGFLVPRIGIVWSALIFGIMHYLSYSSIAEMAAAFVFGLAAGYIFKKTNSLYPSIIGHALFDFSTVLALFF